MVKQAKDAHLIKLDDNFQRSLFLGRLVKAERATQGNAATQYDREFVERLRDLYTNFGNETRVTRKQMNYLLTLAHK